MKTASLAPFTVNKSEVKNTAWVARKELDSFLKERLEKHGEGITPWFELLMERKLDSWWTDLELNERFPD